MATADSRKTKFTDTLQQPWHRRLNGDGPNALYAFGQQITGCPSADIAQTEDANHPLALVNHRQPADLQRLHVPHRLGEVVILAAAMDARGHYIAAYMRGLGADEVVDYNARDFTQEVANCDAVFDTVGGDVAQRSFAVLKPGGRAAFIASGAQAPKPQRADVMALRPPVGRARAHLERIVELYQAGAVLPPEIKLYRLSEAADAHRLSESRHFRGKLVFQVR